MRHMKEGRREGEEEMLDGKVEKAGGVRCDAARPGQPEVTWLRHYSRVRTAKTISLEKNNKS